jgi:hypothetical protein
MNHFKKRLVLLGALVGMTTACQELVVENLNLPDSERALSNPDAVQAVIQSSFNIWWGVQHNGCNGCAALDVLGYFPEAADEFTRTTISRGVQPGFQPRLALNNDAEAPSVWIPRRSWDAFPSGTANTNDAIRVINNGLRITVADSEDQEAVDQTDRALAFARIWQGINLGYLALIQDQAAPADETTVLGDPGSWERENMRPYHEIIPMAVAHLEKGIEIAENGAEWNLTPSFIQGQTYNNEEMIKFAHTMIARLMVYSHRTREERVNAGTAFWEKVRFHTQRGLDFDFGPILQSGVITSTGWSQRVELGSNNQAAFRVDNRVLGMADVSGGFLEWLSTPLMEREPFTVVTPDRRVTGPDGPESSGAYMRYFTGSNIIADRGVYNRSHHAVWRRANTQGVNWNNGLYVIASADENRLFEAEAELRLGNNARAAELINATRTRGVTISGNSIPSNLPPVTAAGVPQAEDCVPRANFGTAPLGQCGTLEDALFYERTIELIGMDPLRGWLDFRGFGFLQDGQLYHMPVPGRYLVSIGIPIYTFGGIGGDGAAVATVPF